MELVAFSMEGYRRFVTKTSVKLQGDMIAFVGPNEAGKSSLLRALAHLHDDQPLERTEYPRRSSVEPLLTWHFLLEPGDKDALADVPDTAHVERLIATKKSDGGRVWRFEPRNPRRSRETRVAALGLLRALQDAEWLEAAAESEDNEFALDSLNGAVELLSSDPNDFTHEQIAAFSELARRLESVEFTNDDREDGDDTTEDVANAVKPQSEVELSAIEAERDLAAAKLRQVAHEEAAASPWRQAVDALRGRLPQIELFDEEDRVLAADYDLVEIADNPPAALGHLAHLADLDLRALRDEAVDAAISDVATRRNAANARLLEAFDKSWNQQGIALQVEVQGTILHLQATTPEDRGLSSIRERSDGMLWFAALLAFSYGWRDRPVLLVDEIETHLHYDAQADLVMVLAQQDFTSKVIYTTHSFGCLPLDLGTGVRVVQPMNAAESRLENGFWRSGAGFSPLLASMGAAAMSFTPTRLAVIAEGPSDAILLPSLFRAAADVKRLPFQVAPGLAMVAPGAVGDLESEAGRVAFVVDGDEGGQAIERKLREAGIEPSRIVRLVNGAEQLETEDLIKADLYARAVNEELRCWNEISDEFSEHDVAPSLRTKALTSWCEARGYDVPDKVAIAQRIVDLNEGALVDPSRSSLIVGWLGQLAAAVGAHVDRPS